ncbi:hypothetical protein F5B19DRAFT_261607 [Rostrohypoxylon terebratum]|nr:hypothetical protein F5B19DRAFT_261607 [Rostrohypoxylon terebratum]
MRRLENETNETQPSVNSSQLPAASTSSVNPKKRLACPYYRHDPAKFGGQRACAGPGFDGINRLKEHLYRKHGCSQPACPRCRRDFKKRADLEEHQRALDICVLAPDYQAEGRMTLEQQEAIRPRMPRNATNESRWKDIYCILFPDTVSQNMPSPYFEPGLEPFIFVHNAALKVTPDSALEKGVRAELWHVLCSSNRDCVKVEMFYDIVRSFPEKLLRYEQLARVEGAGGDPTDVILNSQ